MNGYPVDAIGPSEPVPPNHRIPTSVELAMAVLKLNGLYGDQEGTKLWREAARIVHEYLQSITESRK